MCRMNFAKERKHELADPAVQEVLKKVTSEDKPSDPKAKVEIDPEAWCLTYIYIYIPPYIMMGTPPYKYQ
jgi:hypothetical protein